MLESVKFLDQCFSILLFIVVIILFKNLYLRYFLCSQYLFFNNCAIEKCGNYLVVVKEGQ